MQGANIFLAALVIIALSVGGYAVYTVIQNAGDRSDEGIADNVDNIDNIANGGNREYDYDLTDIPCWGAMDIGPVPEVSMGGLWYVYCWNGYDMNFWDSCWTDGSICDGSCNPDCYDYLYNGKRWGSGESGVAVMDRDEDKLREGVGEELRLYAEKYNKAMDDGNYSMATQYLDYCIEKAEELRLWPYVEKLLDVRDYITMQ